MARRAGKAKVEVEVAEVANEAAGVYLSHPERYDLTLPIAGRALTVPAGEEVRIDADAWRSVSALAGVAGLVARGALVAREV